MKIKNKNFLRGLIKREGLSANPLFCLFENTYRIVFSLICLLIKGLK